MSLALEPRASLLLPTRFSPHMFPRAGACWCRGRSIRTAWGQVERVGPPDVMRVSCGVAPEPAHHQAVVPVAALWPVGAALRNHLWRWSQSMDVWSDQWVTSQQEPTGARSRP